MTNEELLIQFGNHVGIRNLKLNEQGNCQLIIDTNQCIIINEINSSRILVSGLIGQLTDKQAETHALDLLSMNMLLAHADGPYLCWEPMQKILLISLPIESSEIDVLALEESVRYLLQDVQHISQTLREKDINFEELQ